MSDLTQPAVADGRRLELDLQVFTSPADWETSIDPLNVMSSASATLAVRVYGVPWASLPTLNSGRSCSSMN